MNSIIGIIQEEIERFKFDQIINYLNSSDNATPLKANDEHVYIFRVTSTDAELENALNGGQIGGKFWGSSGNYKAKYIFVAKDGACRKTWASNMDFYNKIPARDSNGMAIYDENRNLVYTDNPDYRPPNKFKDHFEEVGCGKSLKDIDIILKKENEYSDDFEVLYPRS